MDGAALTRVWAVFATDSDDDDDEDGAALLTAKEHSPQSRIEYKFNIGTVRMDIPHSPASLWAHDARACLRWSSDGSSSATFDIVSMLLFAGDFAAPPGTHFALSSLSRSHFHVQSSASSAAKSSCRSATSIARRRPRPRLLSGRVALTSAPSTAGGRRPPPCLWARCSAMCVTIRSRRSWPRWVPLARTMRRPRALRH